MNGYYASSAMKISHTNNDKSKSPFNYLLIIDMSIWSLHDGRNRLATLVTKPSDACLCDALSFIVHCCTKPSGIYRQTIYSIDASGYIRPYTLKNIDIRALCWQQEDINRRIGKKSLAYPGLKTTLSAKTWLSMCGPPWGLRMLSVYFCAVRPL